MKALDGKPLVGSYSMLSKFEQCPYQFHQQYVAKTIPYIESPQQKRGNDGHAALEKRVGHGEPLPEAFTFCEPYAKALDGKPAQVEMKAGVTEQGRPCGFFADNVWFRGKIDVAIIDKTNPAANMIDWKFAKKREDATELRMHAVLLQAHYPHVRSITARYVWMNDNALGQPHDVSDTLTTWRSMVGRMGAIKQAMELDHFPKRETPLCRWCSVLSCGFNTNPEKKIGALARAG